MKIIAIMDAKHVLILKKMDAILVKWDSKNKLTGLVQLKISLL